MKIAKMLCLSLLYVTAFLLGNVSGENDIQEAIGTGKLHLINNYNSFYLCM